MKPRSILRQSRQAYLSAGSSCCAANDGGSSSCETMTTTTPSSSPSSSSPVFADEASHSRWGHRQSPVLPSYTLPQPIQNSSLKRQRQKPASSSQASFSHSPKQPSPVAAKAYWIQTILDFLAGILGGSGGAFFILFTDNHSHHKLLLLGLLLPLLSLELWEMGTLLGGHGKIRHTTIHRENKIKLQRIRTAKSNFQQRYGQGIIMGAGLARVLSLQNSDDLLRQGVVWSVVWGVWTYHFSPNIKPTNETKKRRSKRQGHGRQRSLSA